MSGATGAAIVDGPRKISEWTVITVLSRGMFRAEPANLMKCYALSIEYSMPPFHSSLLIEQITFLVIEDVQNLLSI